MQPGESSTVQIAAIMSSQRAIVLTVSYRSAKKTIKVNIVPLLL
jgi:hypothetical protein